MSTILDAVKAVVGDVAERNVREQIQAVTARRTPAQETKREAAETQAEPPAVEEVHVVQAEPLPRMPTLRTSAVRRGEAQQFALQIVRDPEYRKNLHAAAINRTLAPAVEIRILEYAFGKPIAQVEVGTPGSFDYGDIPADTLAERAALLAGVLKGDPAALRLYERAAAQDVASTQARTDETLRMAEAVRESRKPNGHDRN